MMKMMQTMTITLLTVLLSSSLIFLSSTDPRSIFFRYPCNSCLSFRSRYIWMAQRHAITSEWHHSSMHDSNWLKQLNNSRWWRCRDICVSEPNWSSGPSHRLEPRTPAAPVDQSTHLSVTDLTYTCAVVMYLGPAPSPVWGPSSFAGCQQLSGSRVATSSWWIRASSCWWTEHQHRTTPSALPAPPALSQSTASLKSGVRGG